MVIVSTLGVVAVVIVNADDPNLFWLIMSCISSAIAAGYVIYQFFVNGEDFDLFNKS
jgi:hypothetical protein